MMKSIAFWYLGIITCVMLALSIACMLEVQKLKRDLLEFERANHLANQRMLESVKKMNRDLEGAHNKLEEKSHE